MGGVRARAASSKGTVSSVPAWFRADSGTNLIKQEEIVTGRPCGSVVQWSECSHGMREVLGTSPGRAMCFFLPCDILAHDMREEEEAYGPTGTKPGPLAYRASTLTTELPSHTADL